MLYYYPYSIFIFDSLLRLYIGVYLSGMFLSYRRNVVAIYYTNEYLSLLVWPIFLCVRLSHKYLLNIENTQNCSVLENILQMYPYHFTTTNFEF